VNLKNEFLGELLVLEGSDTLHSPEIVEDHLLVMVARTPLGPDHLLGDLACRCGSLKLARGDGFLDERVDAVPVSRLRVRDLVRHTDMAACTLVDLLEHLGDGIGHGVGECLALGISKWNRAGLLFSFEFQGQPPFFTRKPFRRRMVLEFVPVEVLAGRGDSRAESDNLHQPARILDVS